MGKFIIEFDDEIESFEALDSVATVVLIGYISKGNTQYCLGSRMENGIEVHADKLKSGTHKFRVYKP